MDGPIRPAVPGAVAFEVSTLLVEKPSGIGTYGRGLIRALAALRPERAHCQVYRWSRWHRRRLLPVPEVPSRPYITGRFLHCTHGLLHTLDTRIPENFRGVLVATLFDVISALPVAEEKGLSSKAFQARKQADYQRIARRADLVITLSRETRDRFLELAHPAPPVAVIPPGVDEEFLTAGAAPADPARLARLGLRGPYLLTVGALHPRKNLGACLEAFRRARRKVPGLSLAVAGEPGVGWETSLLAQEIRHQGPGIHLLGYMDRQDLAEACAGAEALLFLSHYEGYGLPVLEAMAAGAPVVAARRGGIPDAAGDAALLVDPDDPDAVEAAVLRILSDRNLASRLRSLGRRRALEVPWDAAARAVEEAYAEAAQRHGLREGRRDPRIRRPRGTP